MQDVAGADENKGAGTYLEHFECGRNGGAQTPELIHASSPEKDVTDEGVTAEKKGEDYHKMVKIDPRGAKGVCEDLEAVLEVVILEHDEKTDEPVDCIHLTYPPACIPRLSHTHLYALCGPRQGQSPVSCPHTLSSCMPREPHMNGLRLLE